MGQGRGGLDERAKIDRRMVECMSQLVGFSFWTPLERKRMYVRGEGGEC